MSSRDRERDLLSLLGIAGEWQRGQEASAAIEQNAEVARFNRRLDLFQLGLHGQHLNAQQAIARRYESLAWHERWGAEQQALLLDQQAEFLGAQRSYASWLAGSNERELDLVRRRELDLEAQRAWNARWAAEQRQVVAGAGMRQLGVERTAQLATEQARAGALGARAGALGAREARIGVDERTARLQAAADLGVVGARRSMADVRLRAAGLQRGADLGAIGAQHQQALAARQGMERRTGAGLREVEAGWHQLGGARRLAAEQAGVQRARRVEQVGQEIGAAAVSGAARGMRGSFRRTEALRAAKEGVRDIGLIDLQKGLQDLKFDAEAARLNVRQADLEAGRVEGRAAYQARTRQLEAAETRVRADHWLATETKAVADVEAGAAETRITRGREGALARLGAERAAVGAERAAVGAERVGLRQAGLVARAGMTTREAQLRREGGMAGAAVGEAEGRVRVTEGQRAALEEQRQRIRRRSAIDQAGYSMREAGARLDAFGARREETRARIGILERQTEVQLGEVAKSINAWTRERMPALPDYESMGTRTALATILNMASAALD